MSLSTPALIILIGPSSAGKTTWATQHFEPSEIVSSDALRAVVGAGPDDQTAGTVAFEILHRIVEERLRRGMTTVVDTLGFDDRARERWESQASAAGLPTHLIAFETSPDVCEERNAQREHPILKSALRKQFSRFRQVMSAVSPTTTVTSTAEGDPVIVTPSDETDEKSAGHHTFGLLVSRFDWDAVHLGEQLAEVAVRAESAGFRDIWVMDHFRQVASVGRAWEDLPEAHTALSFVAGMTKSIRLGVLVSGITHRHPVVLGKMVASLDALSGGRVNCGLGIAWDEAEHAAYGIEFPPVGERYALLEETLQMLPLLWGKGSPSFDGRFIKAKELICYPRPIQNRIPIMVGGSGEKRTLRLAAQYSDACNLFGDPKTVESRVQILNDHCAEVDRDPDEIEVTHLTSAFTATDRKDLMARADRLRGRNQTKEAYIASKSGGTVDQQIERFSQYRRAGASHSIVALPDVSGEGSIETFSSVIHDFQQE